MTALPLQPGPRPLLTVADFVALPEDGDDARYELQEGVLVMSPRPVPEHQICIYELMKALDLQMPHDLRQVDDIDVDLQLVPPSRPGTVRQPDISVVTRDGLARRRREGGIVRASEVVLAVEVISLGTQRRDRVIKHGEYADAGIPHYWVVDLGAPGDRPQLTAHHLAGEFGYADAGPVSGMFTATEPFPVRIDLDALV
jgi:Uma2 family endonuclease